MDNYLYQLSPGAIAVPLLSFITLVLNVPPLVWHTKNHNLAASTLVFWIILCNLFNFINALLWPTDNLTSWWNGVGLCDIEVKLITASTVGIVGSLACIMRNLAAVLDTSNTVLMPSRAQRRRRIVFDSIFCIAFPVYMIIIHYIVQPSRYYIFAISGCTPSFDNSWVSIVLCFIWPPIICLVDAYYCGLVIHRVRKYRKQFSDILASSSSNLNKSRFMRLFLMSLTLIVFFLPLQMYVLYRNASFPQHPYSWNNIHGPSWWQIIEIPTARSVIFDRWIRIALGFTIFVFFGLGKDATAMYRSWLLKLGFGSVFPSLTGQHQLPSPGGVSRTSGSSRATLARRAHHFFTKKLSRGTSTETSSSQTPSITTGLFTPSPSDPKKSFPPLPGLFAPSSIPALPVAAHTGDSILPFATDAPAAGHGYHCRRGV
ncbi:GPCR fungal pheromone mating factor, STE3 [Lasallia pustulata]|uniref:GPCR fungal pheromone mating factor, STE3 n=1 Tax=Lasallia pustulata TaxID=136370 RepID=A0A1W5DDQ9_9LECA|nr:GPCR fungal pheromone mating factor, STE3 [Lasallia pustulata]